MSFKFGINAPISPARQTALNLSSTIISYLLNFGIAFFLTPYIIGKLGTAAYGFIGLSNNIISYTSLLTVALNSMAGRFVTIKYHEGNFHDANRYLSSTFFSNVGMAALIVISLGLITVFLEHIINIPQELTADVKFLFTLLFVSSSISLLTGIFCFSTFIKNRLDLSNLQSTGGNVLRAILLVLAYGFFPAHVWYIGAVGVVCSIFYIAANYYFYTSLTPELKLSISSFNIDMVWEMTKAGAWNLLTSLGSMLNQGLELLLANIFVSAYYMGVMSVTKTLPWLILGFFASLANNFQPEFIKYYAEGNMEALRNSLEKSIRILGLFTAIPCAIIFSCGDIFYASWLPGEDTNLMYGLTCVTMFGIMFSMPTQSLWYIFTMTKKVRVSSIVLIKYSIANFLIIIILMQVLDNDLWKIYAIAGTQAVLFMFRFTTFLPFYGARILGFSKYSLFKPVCKVVLSTAVITVLMLPVKIFLIQSYNWISLIACSIVAVAIGIGINYRLSLTDTDRDFIRTRILKLKK